MGETMKTCPVCHAIAFDDAVTCFGCMHPFDQPVMSEPLIQQENRDGDTPSRFVVSFTPAVENGKTVWACSVEPVVR
jgi:hypothetical protein